MAEDFNAIHNGMEDELEAINRLPVGSDERLSAMKAMQIRYNLDLNEYELAAKMQDMEERRTLERERLEFEQEKAEQEAIDRANAAIAESKKTKIQTTLAVAGLALTAGFAALGIITDNSENIRNNSRDRDIKDIFKFADTLRKFK